MADIVRLEEEINKSGIKLRVILDKANIPYYT